LMGSEDAERVAVFTGDDGVDVLRSHAQLL
jgi:hypothetical protein